MTTRFLTTHVGSLPRPEYLLDYARALKDVPTWMIGVRCSLDVVNAREKQRSGRFPGTATSHFEAVHAHGAGYDLEVDTSASLPRLCAELIVARLQSPPEVLARVLCSLSAGDPSGDSPAN